MQSLIHSACCCRQVVMLQSAAEGASGVAVVNRFGIAVDLQPHGGADVAAPVFLQRPAVAAANVDPGQRAGAGVEAGGEDQDVEIVLRAVRSCSPFGVTRSIGLSLTLTSSTLGRRNTSRKPTSSGTRCVPKP